MSRGWLAILVMTLPLLSSPLRAQTAGPIQVTGIWARASVGNAPMALYFTIHDSGAADRLNGITSDAAGMAMLHETKIVNGVAQMREIDGLRLASGGTVTLKPGGMHVMLMDLTRIVRAGDSIRTTMTFDHAPPLTVVAKVYGPGSAGPASQGDADARPMSPNAPAMQMTPGTTMK